MFRPAIASLIAFGFFLFPNPILAATIGLSPTDSLPSARPAASISGAAANASSVSSQIVSLNRESLLALPDKAPCMEENCPAKQLQLTDPSIGFDRKKSDRALAAIDEELLKLFQTEVMQRSDVEGLFWWNGSPIATD